MLEVFRPFAYRSMAWFTNCIPPPPSLFTRGSGLGIQSRFCILALTNTDSISVHLENRKCPCSARESAHPDYTTQRSGLNVRAGFDDARPSRLHSPKPRVSSHSASPPRFRPCNARNLCQLYARSAQRLFLAEKSPRLRTSGCCRPAPVARSSLPTPPRKIAYITTSSSINKFQIILCGFGIRSGRRTPLTKSALPNA